MDIGHTSLSITIPTIRRFILVVFSSTEMLDLELELFNTPSARVNVINGNGTNGWIQTSVIACTVASRLGLVLVRGVAECICACNSGG